MPPEFSSALTTTVQVWPNGGWGIMRHFRQGATVQGSTITQNLINRFVQGNTVTLTVSAIANYWFHVHSDFGSVIWTAYGARLLTDFGYGDIAGTCCLFILTCPVIHCTLSLPGQSDYYTMMERTPLGHNVLNIPEAVDVSGDGNTAQIVGSKGTIANFTTNGGFKCFVLDGSYVYGRNGTVGSTYSSGYGSVVDNYGPSGDSEDYGWLSDYKR